MYLNKRLSDEKMKLIKETKFASRGQGRAMQERQFIGILGRLMKGRTVPMDVKIRLLWQ